MVNEKKTLAKKILENYPATRGDGNGEFLNIVVDTVFGLGHTVDFTQFSVESWTRARRKVLEENPHLDARTSKTQDFEQTVREEIAS